MKTKKNPEIPMVPKAQLKTVEQQRDQYKTEYENSIGDVIWYKAKAERLERENEKLRKANSDGWKEKDKVINNLHYLYTTLTNHIRDMKFASPYSYNYIHLVNFIKELERD